LGIAILKKGFSMKIFNTACKDTVSLEKFVLKNKIEDCKNLFIQIYSGILEKNHIQSILNFLNSSFPKATIVGATTAGEIVDSKIYKNNIVVSFVYITTANIKAKNKILTAILINIKLINNLLFFIVFILI